MNIVVAMTMTVVQRNQCHTDQGGPDRDTEKLISNLHLQLLIQFN